MRMFCSPSKYMQGKDLLKDLNKYTADLGSYPLILAGGYTSRFTVPVMKKAFDDAGMKYDIELFKGECCRATIEMLSERGRNRGNDFVIGIGGGKALDTAKAVAFYLEVPLAIIPTAASTDAPCSGLSILYHEDGVFDDYLFLRNNPNIVLVDEEIIANAPPHHLAAGMGDAFATYYEARAVRRSGKNNQVHAKPTEAGFAIARACREILLRDGKAALAAVSRNICPRSLQNVIETNIYLSGVGFESGGLAAAHGIQKGLTVAEELHSVLHGQKVAFCTVAQMVMENAPQEEMDEVIGFLKSVGLPVSFADMGLVDPSPELVMKLAEKACHPGSTVYNMPMEVTPEVVYNAVMQADTIGSQWGR